MSEFLLLPLGTDGDVLPFCALGRALRGRGHQVRVAANPCFAELVAGTGLELVPLGNEREYRELVDSPHFMSRTLGFHRLMRWVRMQIEPMYQLCAGERSATVLAHPLAFGARVAEARHGIPTATVLLSPAILKSANPLLSWALDHLVVDPLIAPWLNQLRRSVGVPPLTRVFRDRWDSDHLFLALFPEWFAPREPGWPRRLVYAGFPLHESGEGGEEEADLVFTAGTGNRRAHRFFEAAVEATRLLGRRALLLTRFVDQLPPLPPEVRHREYVPLGALLRQSTALVHHGGIGTAAAALAAGIPQVVTPFAHDQPDNAARLVKLGVAQRIDRLRGSELARALAELLDSPSVTSACRRTAARLAAERPLLEAARVLEGYEAAA
jgi:UDP:flavonoid glycosyltransferase YjiC (YdhE family)